MKTINFLTGIGIFLLIFGISHNRSIGQLAIGFGTNLNYSKGTIVESGGLTEIFNNQWVRNKGSNYYMSYYLPKNWKINFQLQTLSYNTLVGSTLDSRSAFRYRTGIYFVPQLSVHYIIPLKKIPQLNFSFGLGMGMFCSHCPKSKPYYIPSGSTSKSSAFNYETGVYSHSWESEYQATKIFTGNLFLGVSYTLYNFHVLAFEAQISKGNTWSNRHTIRYENNGIVPGNDKYEEAFIVVEQNNLNLIFNFRYSLKLSAIVRAWEKVEKKEKSTGS